MEMLAESDMVHTMAYPCPDFLTTTGMKDELNDLCAAAGLTHLVTHQVHQYPKVTYYFVNWFKFNDTTSTIEFRIYDEVMTMSLAEFCHVIGVQNAGRTDRMKKQPSRLMPILNSI